MKAGLDVRVFVDLARRNGVSEARLAEVAGIAPTTLTRRKRGGALTPAESEHVLRLATLLQRAAQVFEDEADAAHWLRTANLALGGAPPTATAGDALVAWRLVRPAYADPAATFSGEGARRFGGRWIAHGRRVVYASLHLSLAALETLAHADRRRFERDYVAFEVRVPHALILELREEDLPADWRERPVSVGDRAVGDAWLGQRASVALTVPSVLVPQERNLLLDPGHPRFGEVRVGEPRPFRFDERL